MGFGENGKSRVLDLIISHGRSRFQKGKWQSEFCVLDRFIWLWVEVLRTVRKRPAPGPWPHASSPCNSLSGGTVTAGCLHLSIVFPLAVCASKQPLFARILDHVELDQGSSSRPHTNGTNHSCHKLVPYTATL